MMIVGKETKQIKTNKKQEDNKNEDFFLLC